MAHKATKKKWVWQCCLFVDVKPRCQSRQHVRNELVNKDVSALMLKLIHYSSTYLRDYFISNFLILYDRIYIQKLAYISKRKKRIKTILEYIDCTYFIIRLYVCAWLLTHHVTKLMNIWLYTLRTGTFKLFKRPGFKILTL